jgi:hypothetical protein
MYYIAVGDIIVTLRHADQRVFLRYTRQRACLATVGCANSLIGFPGDMCRPAHETCRHASRVNVSVELSKLIDTNDALELCYLIKYTTFCAHEYTIIILFRNTNYSICETQLLGYN